MKDVKSFFIGFLSCLCLMLFMGYTPANNDYGSWLKGESTHYQFDFELNEYGTAEYYVFDSMEGEIVRYGKLRGYDGISDFNRHPNLFYDDKFCQDRGREKVDSIMTTDNIEYIEAYKKYDSYYEKDGKSPFSQCLEYVTDFRKSFEGE